MAYLGCRDHVRAALDVVVNDLAAAEAEQAKADLLRAVRGASTAAAEATEEQLEAEVATLRAELASIDAAYGADVAEAQTLYAERVRTLAADRRLEEQRREQTRARLEGTRRGAVPPHLRPM